MIKDLEIEQDQKFQRKSWKFQKIGTSFMLLFILISLTGLIGSGPLSLKKIKSENISIEYPLISRFSHPEQIKVTINNPGIDTIKILISSSYLSNVQIERIVPQPVEESFYKDYVQFSFIPGENSSNILFDLQFRSSMLIKGEWGLKDKTLFTLNHFIFP